MALGLSACLLATRMTIIFVRFLHCPGGEIGRRTGFKILGFVQTGVPVQFRPRAPFLVFIHLGFYGSTYMRSCDGYNHLLFHITLRQ